MTHAVRIHSYGGPEMLRWDDVPTPSPGPGEALIKHTAIGLNFIDVYFRTGLYKAPSLPATIGMEGAGVVTAVGDGVTEIAVGQRVAYAGGPIGAYATERAIRADRLVVLPDGITDQQAASAMLQGLTTQYLLRRTYVVKPGDPVLIHAAAGGVGLLMVQWARHLGAVVIGVVGTEAKAALAREHGAHHVLVGYDDLPGKIRQITGGAMVPVVYDSVGKDTFAVSLDCLAPLGLFVSYGNASGPVPPFEPAILAAKGSLFFTRPTLATYTAKRADLLASASDLFGVLASGAVRTTVNQSFPLREAAEAHRALEERRTTGSTVLLP